MWSLYVDYHNSAVGHMYVVWQVYLFGADVNNVKYM